MPYNVKEWYCCSSPIWRDTVRAMVEAGVPLLGNYPKAAYDAVWALYPDAETPGEQARFEYALGIGQGEIVIDDLVIETVTFNLLDWAYIILWFTKAASNCPCGCCERSYPSTCLDCLGKGLPFPAPL